MPLNKPAMPRFTGTIIDKTPSWNTPAGVLGTPDELTTVMIVLDATDPLAGNISYTVVVGALPIGLSLSLAGTISGVLAEVGSTSFISFTVRATSDVSTIFTDRAFSITVVDLAPSHHYQSLIDTHAVQLFVEVTGNDSTGDGSSTNPFLTINAAVELMTVTGGAVIIGPGTFTINTENGLVGSPFSRGFLTDYNNPISFFGTPNETILQSNPLTARDAHVWGCQNPNTEAFGLIFQNMVGTRTDRFSVAMCSNSLAISTPASVWTAHGTVYNCAFMSLNDSMALTTGTIFYDNSTNSAMTLNNCSFQASGWQLSWTTSANTDKFLNNTAASPVDWKLVGTQVNSDFDVTFDVDWHIITNGDDTMNGVYSGTNAWP